MAVAVTLWDRFEGSKRLAYAGLSIPSIVWGPDRNGTYSVWKKEMFDNPEDNQYIKEQIETTGKLKKEAERLVSEGGENLHTPYLNPVEGDFTGFPKTLVMTAEYDYLRPECELFKKKSRMPEFMYVIYAMEGLSTDVRPPGLCAAGGRYADGDGERFPNPYKERKSMREIKVQQLNEEAFPKVRYVSESDRQ